MRRYKPTFFISQAFKGLFRNGMMTVASVTVLISCLIVMGCFSMLLMNINKNLENLGGLNEIVVRVYSDSAYSEGDEKTLHGALEGADNTFLGWSTDPNAEEPDFLPGQKYTVSSSDSVAGKIVFYAVWENSPVFESFKVNYETFGVSLSEKLVADENSYSVGDTISFPSSIESRNPSILFMGWSLTPDGSSGTITNGEYVVSEDDVKGGNLTLYAIWSQQPIFSEYTISYNANGVEVSNLKTDASLKLEYVGTQLSLLSNVAEDGIKFISKEETLQSEKENYKDYPGLQSFLEESENPYPDTFIVTYIDNSKVEALELQIKNIEGVDKVRCRSDIAESIESLKNSVIVIFAWFMIILFVVSIFVIMNTIKLALNHRKEEIEIMRYIGATRWFISLPFDLEGIIIGLFSGTCAFLVQWYAYGYVQKMVMSDINMIEIIPFSDIWLIIFVGCTLIGVLTGLIGSKISIKKYSKV